MVRKVPKFTRAQVWEFMIVLTIILVVIYRLALVYDFVPDQYQPATIIYNSYIYVRGEIRDEADQPTTMGHVAEMVLDKLKLMENYIKGQEAELKRRDEVAKRCNENILFRYFMFMGDEDNPNCSEQNMRLNAAMGEIENTNKSDQSQSGNNSGTTPAQTQPVAPASNSNQ